MVFLSFFRRPYLREGKLPSASVTQVVFEPFVVAPSLGGMVPFANAAQALLLLFFFAPILCMPRSHQPVLQRSGFYIFSVAPIFGMLRPHLPVLRK